MKIGTKAIDDLAAILDTGATAEQIVKLRFEVEGMSIEKLRELLKGSMTVDRLMWFLFEVPGMTLVKLEELLSKTNMTPVLLETLLKLTGKDISQLERLLNLVTDAKQLAQYLGLAGGLGQAARLESLLKKANALGDINRVDDLLKIAKGNANKFQELSDAVDKFKLLPATSPPSANLHGYTGINFPHFLQRHTYEYFDFNQIKPNNTLWPQGTDVAALVEQALTWLDNQIPPIRLTPFQQPPQIVPLSNGISVQIGSNNSQVIGQFFPLPNPSAGTINFTRQEMQSFKKLVVP